jgi:hypothetical protein
MKNILVSLLFVTVSLFGFQLQPEAEKALLGKWNMVSVTPEGDKINWTLNLKQDDGKLKCTVSVDEGEKEAKDLTITDGKIHLKTQYRDNTYDIDVRVKDNAMTGTWTGGGDTGAISGKKAN